MDRNAQKIEIGFGYFRFQLKNDFFVPYKLRVDIFSLYFSWYVFFFFFKFGTLLTNPRSLTNAKRLIWITKMKYVHLIDVNTRRVQWTNWIHRCQERPKRQLLSIDGHFSAWFVFVNATKNKFQVTILRKLNRVCCRDASFNINTFFFFVFSRQPT